VGTICSGGCGRDLSALSPEDRISNRPICVDCAQARELRDLDEAPTDKASAVEVIKKISELADGRRHYRDTEGGEGCFDALGDIRDLCDRALGVESQRTKPSGDRFYDPDYDADLNTFWKCEACGAENSRLDGECQYCECEGEKCRRGSCSDPKHFGPLCENCQQENVARDLVDKRLGYAPFLKYCCECMRAIYPHA